MRRSTRSKRAGSSYETIGEQVLMKIQKFIFAFVFSHLPESFLKAYDGKSILKNVKYMECPQQQNSFDCALFGMVTLLHLVNDKIVSSETI